MDPITIKPHHFMDIIKLYGAGLETFVPDEALGHDFYRVGNMILTTPAQPLLLTTGGDHICFPCRQYRGACQDSLTHIPGYTSKDAYNRQLDTRILTLFSLTPGPHPARTLCKTLYEGRQKIFDVWQEEDAAATRRRFELFTAGAQKYLARWPLPG